MRTSTPLTPAALAGMTMPQLVAAYNSLVKKPERVTRFRSKDDGIAKIKAAKKAAPKTGAATAPRGLGVGKLARELLGKDNGLTYEAIAAKVNEKIAGAAATAKSIAWYAHSMRANGETVADRPRANAAPTVH